MGTKMKSTANDDADMAALWILVPLVALVVDKMPIRFFNTPGEINLLIAAFCAVIPIALGVQALIRKTTKKFQAIAAIVVPMILFSIQLYVGNL